MVSCNKACECHPNLKSWDELVSKYLTPEEIAEIEQEALEALKLLKPLPQPPKDE